jgi:hypothetical protein
MSTVANVISSVQVELGDPNGNDWTSARLLPLVKKAVKAIEPIIYEFGYEGAELEHTFDTVIGQSDYSLPTDFGTFIGLYRTADYREIALKPKREWRLIESAGGVNFCLIKNNASGVQKLYLKDTPSTVESLTMDYYPFLDVSGYTTATTMPWGGKFDPIIEDYAKMRAQNIYEMDTTFDAQMYQSLKDSIMFMLQGQSARRISRVGGIANTNL